MEGRIIYFVIGLILFINFFFTVQAYFVYSRLVESPIDIIFFPADGVERFSPSDWIHDEDVTTADTALTVQLDEPLVTHFANTNSMDPVLDEFTNGVEVKAHDVSDIHVGDIVAYFSEYSRQYIVHRVVKINYDSEGWYAIMRGDNQLYSDPGRIRWDQIEGVTVGLLY